MNPRTTVTPNNSASSAIIISAVVLIDCFYRLILRTTPQLSDVRLSSCPPE
jgi:hypothetical protein